MENELLDYIKELSLRDKKNLIEKTLKISEEQGELAKSVLAYENAAGSIHKFIEKERMLDESVDVILTAISIAYSLGYNHDDIEEMMQRKTKKWQGIQTKEEKIEGPIPYEIHVTIKHPGPDDETTSPIEDFIYVCKELKVKPIVLDLENNGESVMKDVMTSSHHFGDNKSAYQEALWIETRLKAKRFEVLRVKIETVPWHPAAPVNDGDKMPKDCYFEAHIGCIISIDEKLKLSHLAQTFGAHLSKNAFKKIENGKFVNMVTLRNKDCTYSWFKAEVDDFVNSLNKEGILFENIETEFCLYDTKISHDYLWLK